jgi:hypothetical protein
MAAASKRRSEARAREARARAQAADITPMEYLCTIYRDEEQPLQVRLAAAMAVAPYMHPRLQAIEARVTQLMSAEEEARRHEERRQQAVRAIKEVFGEQFGQPQHGVGRSPVIEHQPPAEPAPDAAERVENMPTGQPREFAAPGPLEAAPGVVRLPVHRYRRPRPIGSGWGA